MQTITSEFVKDKKVLLRYDIDVALGKVTGDRLQVIEDFKLKAGLDTLKLCLENGAKVIIIGHLGRPQSVYTIGGRPFADASEEQKGNPQSLSAKPIQEWLELHLRGEISKTSVTKVDFAQSLEQADKSTNKLVLLENVRFFHGEVPGADYHATCTSKTCDVDFAHKLAGLGEVYVNEAFSAHNAAASTTMVPTLLPHAAGLHFVKEVETLLKVRNNPKKPFVVIMGGVKVADKLPVINVLAEKADAVLVGGKLASEITLASTAVERNVMVGRLNEAGTDIAPETVESWKNLIMGAKMIVWNGPLGKFEDPKNDATRKVTRMILDSSAEVIIGGGDSVAALSQYGLLQKAQEKAFISVGGGAMLKLLETGTLPTIEALR